ncbi:hemerythrin-like metal-binding domain protein [Candidatus Electrothrix aarhusensis]|uniref:Hemerythrin-like metal-binding domain protein n=1 Tax=Candidatus Electrothrix aarhusensis TaxID=1859131 RepID=A0A444IRA8_9BACT|nr:hemerythrin-like metal-binding domain protein [Candidatus Electrothrix aarhusensis]
MKTTHDWTYEYCDELKKIDPQYERFCMIISELSVISDKEVLRRLNTGVCLDWNKEYNVGVKEIDAQHKKFLRIIKKMAALHTQADKHAKVEKLQDQLLDYAHLHFRSEEALMERYKYPKIHEQKTEHALLMAELHRQVSAARRANSSVAKMLYFLVQWFIKHTVYSDREIGLHIANMRKARAFRINMQFFTRDIRSFFPNQLDLRGHGRENSLQPSL